MSTLHIEHEIVDFDLWKAAFDRFADLRTRAGVRAHRIQQPIDNPRYVVVDLEFGTTGEAQAFADLFRSTVWSSRDNAPALVGTPQTTILRTIVESPEGTASHATAKPR
jgi:hypothetical protein